MKITYDAEVDALSITFRETTDTTCTGSLPRRANARNIPAIRS